MRSVLLTTARLITFVFLITVTSANLRADDKTSRGPVPLGDGETGILVLQDGGVLAGQITRAADWYVVARGAGQMQIAQARVLLVCRTLEEAYEFRRQQIGGEKASDHLRLAEWCIRYELRAEAGRELAEARRIDPDQPRLALLERRLEKGSGRPKEKESVYLAAVNARAKPPFDKLRPEEQAAGVAPSTATIAAELPEGVVVLFTRKVQPVLVNNCTTAGCHQSGSKQSFQLDRAILRGESNRRSTMHNLEAALALIDRAHPDQSPLLTVPRRTHGGTAGPIFGPRQEQAFKHVVDWVALVVPQPAADVTADSVEQQLTKTDGDTTDVSQLRSRRKLAAQAATAIGDDGSATLKTPHRLQIGAQLKSWQPRDAFDPEIFNRGQRARTHGDLSATQPSSAAAGTTAETR